MSKNKARKYKEKFQKYEDKGAKENDFPIKLCMWYFDQCDPKKCSGMILKRQGYLSTLSKSAKFGGVVLTPTATKYISPEDHELVEKHGLCVIDCSWQHFDDVKVKSIKAHERLLPYCLASNPVNYGKEIKLNCAEALAGALLLSGFSEEAEEVMDVFKWGPAFFSLNEIYFERYLECTTSEEIFNCQNELIKEVSQMREDNRNRQIDLPPTSSDEEDEDEQDNDNEVVRNFINKQKKDEEEDDDEEERKSEDDEIDEKEQNNESDNEEQVDNNKQNEQVNELSEQIASVQLIS